MENEAGIGEEEFTPAGTWKIQEELRRFDDSVGAVTVVIKSNFANRVVWVSSLSLNWWQL